MKVIILRNNLKDALSMAERGIGDNLNLPILKNFLIKASNDGIEVVSTNLEIGITTRASAKVMESGSITVPAALFSSLVSNITSERLDIEKKGSVLEVKANNYEAVLPLSSVEDFPIIPSVENQKDYIEIRADVISDALSQVATAAQFSELRPEISGIFFDFEPNQLVLAGTDVFRLAEKKLGSNLFTSSFNNGFKCIIPLRTVQEILRVFKGDQPLRFYFDENQVLVKSESSEIISRLINGNFPDYRGLKIIPADFKTEIEVEREEFMNALKLTGAVSQAVNDIKLKATDGKKNLEIASTEKSLGKTKAVLPAKIIGEGTEVCFNWRYLFEGLKGFTQNSVILGLNNDDKPAMLKSSDASYLYVLMPIRQ